MDGPEDPATASYAPMLMRSKIWMERGGRVALSDWHVQLLEAVETVGTLKRAAEQLDVPYRTAWKRIKEIEAAFGVKVLTTTSGGSASGSSHLTVEGRDLCVRFRRVATGVQEVVQRRFATEFAQSNE